MGKFTLGAVFAILLMVLGGRLKDLALTKTIPEPVLHLSTAPSAIVLPGEP